MASVDEGPLSDGELTWSMEEDERRVRQAPSPTLGALFPDGSAIDRLQDDQLILWSYGQATIDLVVDFQGRRYLPLSLNSQLEEALRWPRQAFPLENLESLVGEITACLTKYVEVDETAALLLAAFVLSTWVVECLPVAPVLNLWGSGGAETTLLDLLSCLCRRPMRLFQPSVGELSQLPRGLCPTVLVKTTDQRSLLRLLAAAAEPDMQWLRKGVPVNLRCAVVACTPSPLPVSALGINLHPGVKYSSLRAHSQELSEHFQSRLLGYRLSQHLGVRQSDFDRPNFSAAIRPLARILGATLAGAPDLQEKLVSSLQTQEEQSRIEGSQSLEAIVVEALLVLAHENKPAAFVFEITQLANGILLARHDRQQLSPKAVGAILRNGLGLPLQRKGPGYELTLTSEISRRVHQLARSYGALSLLQPRPDCSFCGQGSENR